MQHRCEILPFWQQLTDGEKEIVEFYREAYDILKPKGFQMLYLEASNIRENILQINLRKPVR